MKLKSLLAKDLLAYMKQHNIDDIYIAEQLLTQETTINALIGYTQQQNDQIKRLESLMLTVCSNLNAEQQKHPEFKALIAQLKSGKENSTNRVEQLH